MFIQIDLQGEAVLFGIALKTVHGGDGSLVFIEPPEHPAARVVNVAHEDAFGTPAFEPVMTGAVHLEHCSAVVLSLPPLKVRLPFSMSLPQVFFHEPGTYRLVTHGDPFTFLKLLCKEGGAEAGIDRFVEGDDPIFEPAGKLSL